jgi:acetyltransferase-like isoleucine patch superfamily enzyme
MKTIVKWSARNAAKVILLPLFLFYEAWAWMIRDEQPFCTLAQAFSLLPGKVGEYLRREFYVHVLADCATDCCISFGTLFTHPTAVVGRGTYIGARCMIGTVTIGDHVLIGSNVDILSGRHQHGTENANAPIGEQDRKFERIHIGDNSWIGNSAVVMADVGKGCVVGAGSVVVKPVEDYSVVAGNPAKLIRKREPMPLAKSA